jgi:(S)-sulfolactate dehydrogenase
MKILISEFIDESALSRLKAHHDVVYDPGLVDDFPRLLREAAGCDALIVRNRTQVRGELLDALQQCKVIGRLGVGLDNIDLVGCEQKNIQVFPATGANAQSVAEYVITTAMMLLRGAYTSTPAVAEGKWPRIALSQGRELNGKTLGVVGFGLIGQLTARLGKALGLQLLAFDPAIQANDSAAAELGVTCASLEDLCHQADVISLHIPLLETTRKLFDQDRIRQVKAGAILINTARGGVVDELAVVHALQSGHLGGAALDVFEAEPLSAMTEFQGCPNLILTPHIAGLTAESNVRVSSLVADRVLEALA